MGNPLGREEDDLTTTFSWLETYNGVAAGYTLVIEGTPTTYGTDTTANMTGLYSTSAAPFNSFSDPIGGLSAAGTLGGKIDLYAQDISPETVEFRIADATGAILTSVLREAYSSGHRTYLTGNVVSGSTDPINTQSTSGFAASGTIYIGDEAIGYTGTSAGVAFTGITRGKYTLNQTDSGAAFSSSHIIGNNITASAVTAPAVTDYPRTWYGRWIHLLMHYKDPLTGTYNKADQATKVFTGRIESYRDEGDGAIVITAVSALALLNRPIGHEQWTALLNPGWAFGTDQDRIVIHNSQATAYTSTTSLTAISTGTVLTHDEVAKALKDQFAAWQVAGTGSGGSRAGDLWDVSLRETPEGLRYVVSLNANTTSITGSAFCSIALHPLVWSLLGFTQITSSATGTLFGETASILFLNRSDPTNDNYFEVVAKEAPVVYVQQSLDSSTFTVSVVHEIGVFSTQSPSDIGVGAGPSVNGMVQIKGGLEEGIYAVTYTGGSPSKLKFWGKLDMKSGEIKASVNYAPKVKYVRLDEVTNPPIVKQVWYQSGDAAALMLKALLSTGGASGYNHATYDTFTGDQAGFGAGVPASLVDVNSFKELDDVEIQFLVTEPKPFYAHLEPILAASNRYVVWRAASATSNPKLTVVRPQLETTVELNWQLTESNKAGAVNGNPDRVRVERAADGVINRVVVKYGHGLDGSTDATDTIVVEDIASQSDYGRRRTMTLEAPMVKNVPTLVPRTIGTALGYFSRPLAIATRSYNASMMRMAPGDTVSITDNYIVDPTTGTRGGVVYGWVLSTSFDLATGRGQARIVFLPEKIPRIMKWAPSARVDETAGGSGYNAGAKTLTLKEHEYSNASESADALNFASGDKVHIYSLDEGSPLEWFDTIASSPSSTTMVLTTGLAGFDTSKRYVVEFDDIATVQSTQKTSHAYIADDADLSTGGSPTTPYDWSGGTPPFLSTWTPQTVDYTKGMLQPNTTYMTKGEPVSVHKLMHLVDGANSLLSYKTRNVYLNLHMSTIAEADTTTTLLYVGWIPIYGHCGTNGNRALTCRLRAWISTGGPATATYTIRSSPRPPIGTSFTSYSFPLGSTSVTYQTTSTTQSWSGELTLQCSPGPATNASNTLMGTWITVEAVCTAGGNCTFNQLFVCEAAL